MGLKLRKREIPVVSFRRDLPDWLADGAPCFIEIDGRAGGLVNPEYVAGMEQMGLRAQVMDRKAGRIEDDAEFVERNRANIRETMRHRLGVLYDACVIDWRSNIINDDAPITCSRENFLALAEVKVPEIAMALKAFEAECLKAGKIIHKADEELAGN